ncbi:MAG: hypothetical protein ACI3T9_05345 [Romboutsia timonensis]
MINISDYDIFSNNMETLEEISKDSSDKQNIQYMTHSTLRAVNFDRVKREYANNLGLSEEVIPSVDAFAVLNDRCVMIEFKNGDMHNEKNLKQKVSNSLLVLCDILKCTISDTRKSWKLILVYNETKNRLPNQIRKSSVKIASHICEMGNTEIILFDMEKFKSIYFKEVHTYTEQQFEEYLSKCNVHSGVL